MGTHAKRLTDDEKQQVVNTFQQVKSVMRTVFLFAGRVSGPGVRRVLAERGLYKPKQHKSVKAKPDIVAKVVSFESLFDGWNNAPNLSDVRHTNLTELIRRFRANEIGSNYTVEDDE